MTPPAVDVLLSPDDLHAALRSDVADGLTRVPKEVPPKWFYDERGCQLFEQITRLPEYYPTRRERLLLDEHADQIAAFSGAATLVELGSGTSEKTRHLLDAFVARRGLRRFVPFDVSEATLRQAAESLSVEYPTLGIHAVVGDFERHLGALPGGDRRLMAFLGGTLGNLVSKRRAEFLAELAATMEPGDTLLLGTDLVKAPDRLVAAYDDAAGVTAEFNRNLLWVLNRELDADFVPDRFAHRAVFDADEEWIEMWLVSTDPRAVTIGDLDLTVAYEAGEAMRTEISAKFRRSGVEEELGEAQLALARWWTDPDGDYALSLSVKE